MGEVCRQNDGGRGLLEQRAGVYSIFVAIGMIFAENRGGLKNSERPKTSKALILKGFSIRPIENKG